MSRDERGPDEFERDEPGRAGAEILRLHQSPAAPGLLGVPGGGARDVGQGGVCAFDRPGCAAVCGDGDERERIAGGPDQRGDGGDERQLLVADDEAGADELVHESSGAVLLGSEQRALTLPAIVRAVRDAQIAEETELFRWLAKIGRRRANQPRFETPKMMDVLRWLCAGLTVNETAHKLGISNNAAIQRMFYLRRTLGAKTNEQLVVMAMQRGLLPAVKRCS